MSTEQDIPAGLEDDLNKKSEEATKKASADTTTTAKNQGVEFKTPELPETKYETFDVAFEKYKLQVDLLKWFIGTVGLTLVTYIINWGFKDREQGLHEIEIYDRYANDQVVLHKYPKNRLLLAQFYSCVTPSDKLREGWGEYLKIVQKDYDAFLAKEKEVTEKIQNTPPTAANKIELTNLLNKQKMYNEVKAEPLELPNKSNVITPRIFIQYYGSAQQPLAVKVQNSLVQAGYKVDLELIKNKKSDGTVYIRYFNKSDIEISNIVLLQLKNMNINAKLQYFGKLKAKPGTVEIWFT